MAHKPFVQEKGSSHRPARMASHLKEELSTMLGELKDPRLADIGFLTITTITVASDLKNATVKFALMGEDKKYKQIEAALNDAAGFLRRELMQTLTTKVTPHLTFKYDRGYENTLQIDQLLKQVAAEAKPENDSDDSSEE